MSEVGIRSLKQNASAVVADAVAGETVTITDRGRPVALLTPIPSSPLESLVASGAARCARRSITDLGQPSGGPSIADAIVAQRDAERY